MQNIRSAVAEALRKGGAEILGAPARFVGAMMDVADEESPEMRALAVGCDAMWLAPYTEALESRDADALVDAAARGTDRLSSVYMIDAGAARSLSLQAALGVADYLGVEPPAVLVAEADAGAYAEEPAVAQGARGNAEQMGVNTGPATPDPLQATDAPGQQPVAIPGQPAAAHGPGQQSAAASAPVQPTAPPQAPVPRGRKDMPLILVAALTLVVIVGVVLAVARPDLLSGVFGQQGLKKRVAIRASISAPSFGEDSSKVPVHIVGTTVEGDSLDEHAYIDSDGYGLELPPGTYTATLDCSPIAADGTVYDAPKVEVPIEVPEPEPQPALQPASQPAPEPEPAPEPAPAPQPAPTPEPTPAPQPAPTPEPTPAPQPAPTSNDTSSSNSSTSSSSSVADSSSSSAISTSSVADGSSSSASSSSTTPGSSSSTTSSTSGSSSSASSTSSALDDSSSSTTWEIVIVIILDPLPEDQVTPELLDQILAWLLKDPEVSNGSSSNEDNKASVTQLVDGARQRHDDYVAKKKAEEEEARRKAEEEAARKKAEEEEARKRAEEEEARRKAEEEAQRLYEATHYDCEYFSVAVPESWAGDWNVEHTSWTQSGFVDEKWTFTTNGQGAAWAIVYLHHGNGYPKESYPGYTELLGITSYDQLAGLFVSQTTRPFFYDGGATITAYTI